MPMNPPPPRGVRPPKAPAAPPPPVYTGRVTWPPPPPPPPVRFYRDERPIEPPAHWSKVLLGWVIIIAVGTFVGYAINSGLEDAKVTVNGWVKEKNYKKCTGEFNTLSCHERLSKERELKYKDYTRGE